MTCRKELDDGHARAYHLKVLPPRMPPQPTRVGPRPWILPTLHDVNMIVWSLDNHLYLPPSWIVESLSGMQLMAA
nr:hypothetical protein [Tanacetum cinerariifolium]